MVLACVFPATFFHQNTHGCKLTAYGFGSGLGPKGANTETLSMVRSGRYRSPVDDDTNCVSGIRSLGRDVMLHVIGLLCASSNGRRFLETIQLAR